MNAHRMKQVLGSLPLRPIAIAAAVIAIFFHLTYIQIGGKYGSDIKFAPLQMIGALLFGDGGFGDVLLLSFFLLLCIAPTILLMISLFSPEGKRTLFITLAFTLAALIALASCIFAIMEQGYLYGGGIFGFLLDLIALAITCASLFWRNDNSVVALAGFAILGILSLALFAFAIEPFGSHGYRYVSYFASTLLFWVSGASAIAIAVLPGENGKATPAGATRKGNREKTDTAQALRQIKELKELLDMEIITQDEFNAKKRELLGL